MDWARQIVAKLIRILRHIGPLERIPAAGLGESVRDFRFFPVLQEPAGLSPPNNDYKGLG